METMEELNIRLSFSKKSALPLLALFFLCWHPGFIGSESLTLTTYYPAPYGGYVSLLTTSQTLLARDGGNVGIGTGATAPTGRLDVRGGYVNIIDAEGGSGTWRLGAVNGVPGSYGTGITAIRADGGLRLAGRALNMSTSADLFLNTNGRVGIGTLNPDRLLQVAGDTHINGDLYLDSRILNFCSSVGYGVGGSVSCPSYTDNAGIARRMLVVGFMGDGVARVTGFLPGGSTTSSWGTFVVLGEDWGGTMMCCKL